MFQIVYFFFTFHCLWNVMHTNTHSALFIVNLPNISKRIKQFDH